MKWILKVGSNYMQNDGTWTTTPTINQFFIDEDDVAKFVDFRIESFLPEGVTAPITEDYDLKIYPVSAWEYDYTYSNQTNLINGLKALTSANYIDGSRLTARSLSGGTAYYNYYSLRQDLDRPANDGKRIIRLTDSSEKYWELIATWTEQLAAGVGILSGRTSTVFKDIKFITLPNGEEAPSEYKLIETVSAGRNNKNLDIELFHFDLPNAVNNDENLYLNYTRKSDGTPTELWTRLGGVSEKLRQQHLVDRLYELYKRPRYQMNANFYSDAEITPLSVLYDASESNRVFALNGIEINYATGIHQGEVLEIFASDTPTLGEYNDDYDNDNEFS
jgi:hypothetical protein